MHAFSKAQDEVSEYEIRSRNKREIIQCYAKINGKKNDNKLKISIVRKFCIEKDGVLHL